MNADEIEVNLDQFTGTETWWKHPLFPRYTYTDGVRYLAQACCSWWLVETIFACQHERRVRREEFQLWMLKVADRKATLTCDNGNGNIVYRQEIEYTDFPLSEITLYFENDVLVLPAER